MASQIDHITQETTRGTGATITTEQTVTHGKVETVNDGARTTTEATGAATGSRVSALTGFDDAGFTISFSVPILGGLNASGTSPRLDP